MPGSVALVEDDEILRENLRDFLEMNGYEVRAYPDQDSALEGLPRALPDIAILDIHLGLEAEAGFEICGELRRAAPCLPIVFLTSHDGEAERIAGLMAGADDHLSKHLSFDFLLLRIEALVDRYRSLLGQGHAESPAPLVLGHVKLDRVRRVASWKGRSVDLPLTHYWILEDLLSSPGEVRSHDDLMRAARTRVEPNTIAAHISLIRRRFKALDPHFDAIRTERALGYRWLEGDS